MQKWGPEGMRASIWWLDRAHTVNFILAHSSALVWTYLCMYFCSPKSQSLSSPVLSGHKVQTPDVPDTGGHCVAPLPLGYIDTSGSSLCGNQNCFWTLPNRSWVTNHLLLRTVDQNRSRLFWVGTPLRTGVPVARRDLGSTLGGGAWGLYLRM